jgi:putative transposase|tara:strand:+ start:102 stop:395 length:294 start_codon:yes stop_codon:yes gene_type:complete
MKKRKHFTEKEKAQIALQAIKGEKTLNQLASIYQIHSNQVLGWKTQLLNNLPFLFQRKNKKDKELKEKEKVIDELHRLLGKRDSEIEWLQKKIETIK